MTSPALSSDADFGIAQKDLKVGQKASKIDAINTIKHPLQMRKAVSTAANKIKTRVHSVKESFLRAARNSLTAEENRILETYERARPNIIVALEESGIIISQREEGSLLEYLVDHKIRQFDKVEPFIIGYRAGAESIKTKSEERITGLKGTLEATSKEL